MMERIIDYLVLLCAAWIIVARLFFMQIRFATIAAAIRSINNFDLFVILMSYLIVGYPQS